MGQTTTLRTCTAYRPRPDDGPDTRPRTCGIRAQCTRVIIEAFGGQNRQKHWACPECRLRMDLPDHGVIVSAGGRMRPWRG